MISLFVTKSFKNLVEMAAPIPGRQQRILSTVTDTWGQGTVYEYDYEEETLEAKRSVIKVCTHLYGLSKSPSHTLSCWTAQSIVT